MAGLKVQTPDGLGTLQLDVGGGYRLEYNVTNLQGDSHAAAKVLLKTAEAQHIPVRASYLGNQLIINLDGTTAAGKLVGMGEVEALFVDTARLYAESAQKYTALGRSEVAAEQLKLANKFNPAAQYKLEDSVARIAGAGDRQAVSELAKLQDALGKNLLQFAKFTSEEKIVIFTKMRAPIETVATAETAIVTEAAATDSLKLVRSASGVLRLVGTVGTYIALLEGMAATTAAVQEKFHEDDLSAAREAEGKLSYAAKHQDRRNDDACREAEICR